MPGADGSDGLDGQGPDRRALPWFWSRIGIMIEAEDLDWNRRPRYTNPKSFEGYRDIALMTPTPGVPR